MTTPFELFICYRRNHATAAVTLFNRLREDFGDAVFIDHECLVPIEGWRRQIDKVISGCGVMVAVLSEDWLIEIERRHRDGIDDEVVRELVAALDAGVPILPLLVDNAKNSISEDLQRFPAESPVLKVVGALREAHALRWRAGSGPDLHVMAATLAGRLRRFAERFVERCQARLAIQLAGGGSDPWPVKFKHFERALRRPALMEQIENEMRSKPGVLVLLAEEGMGKTFVLGELLRRRSQSATVLVDASDPCWRDGFVKGLQALMLEARPVLASEAELQLALAQPLCIAIDGLNEPDAIDRIHWAALLDEVLRQQSTGKPWSLIVTVRTASWQRMTQQTQRLRDSNRVQVVEIPSLSLDEAAEVAKALGFPWTQCSQAVRQQLRKPRMLVSVSRLKPEVLEGWELSEGLVTLLDLQQQDSLPNQLLSSEDYLEVLRRNGELWLANLPPQREQLRAQLSALDDYGFESALRELRDRGLIDRKNSKLVIHVGTAELAVALHLIDKLRQLSGSHQVLVERIEAILADAQSDFAARVLVHALSAMLQERLIRMDSMLEAQPRKADPQMAALFLAWAARFNRNAIRRIPWSRWLLPEFIQLTETAELRDASNWLALALEQGGPPPADHAALLEAFDKHWFTSIDLNESWSSNEKSASERDDFFAQARRQIPSFRNQPQSRLRRTALDVAARCRLSPAGRQLYALCLSVSIQPVHGWDRLLQWVQASRVDWLPHLQEVWRQIVDAGYSPSLHQLLAKLIYRIWPIEECRQLLGAALEPDEKPGFAQPIANASEFPDQDALERALGCVKEFGTDAPPRDLAIASIWSRDLINATLADAVDHAADPESTPRFLGSRLSPFMPLLSPNQRLKIRRRLARSTTGDLGQLDDLSVASCFGLSETRRVAAILRQLRFNNLSSETLAQARLSPRVAEKLVERLLRAPESPWSGRLALWLNAGLSHENEAAIRAAMVRVIPHLRGHALPPATERHLLNVATVIGLAKLATTLMPEGWCYPKELNQDFELAEMRNWTMANSGIGSPEELRQRCKPGTEILTPELTLKDLARQRIELTRTALMKGAFEWLKQADVREAFKDDPPLIQVVLNGGNGDRAAAVAYALDPEDTPLWLQLTELAIKRDYVDTMESDGIPIRYHAIFKTADSLEARRTWASALENVSNDEALLQLVIAASKGRGRNWLQEIAQISKDALPHDLIKSANIAAFAGIRSRLPQIQSLRDQSSGWIAKGFDRAIDRFQREQLARDWLERFHAARDWPQACGYWLLHLESVDLRYLMWEQSVAACQLQGADTYVKVHHDDRQYAAKRNADTYRKTRFGLEIV